MKPVAVFLLEPILLCQRKGPDDVMLQLMHKSGARKLSRAGMPSWEDLRTAAMQALSPSGSKSSSGTATPSAADSSDKRSLR